MICERPPTAFETAAVLGGLMNLGRHPTHIYHAYAHTPRCFSPSSFLSSLSSVFYTTTMLLQSSTSLPMDNDTPITATSNSTSQSQDDCLGAAKNDHRRHRNSVTKSNLPSPVATPASMPSNHHLRQYNNNSLSNPLIPSSAPAGTSLPSTRCNRPLPSVLVGKRLHHHVGSPSQY